jgi:hypothetical protein
LVLTFPEPTNGKILLVSFQPGYTNDHFVVPRDPPGIARATQGAEVDHLSISPQEGMPVIIGVYASSNNGNIAAGRNTHTSANIF